MFILTLHEQFERETFTELVAVSDNKDELLKHCKSLRTDLPVYNEEVLDIVDSGRKIDDFYSIDPILFLPMPTNK